ncbi:hypothetical protein POJ06DRAFT_131879 [Lipomyces tetrasporus]|uniref:Galactose oxidase n=1 Tax=Lipomyces tetrasporus TaxID=54092 RepID=A0AAD7QPV0_9ASCO|nr:uncharacterized protein POJ06DRAFT_131879 [Lipomyces tetrasporus]KAJ8099274.1 hypothetical protein POJ06DRAFT_131879 [Lipomyces tetrasporus]
MTMVSAVVLGLLSLSGLSGAWTSSFRLSSSYYIQAADSSFYKAIVSDDVSPTNSTLINNINDGSIVRLSTPPSNASIILGHDNIIYAFYGACGSAIQVAAFDDESDKWTDLSVADGPSYHAAAVLFRDATSPSLIFIFGGYCRDRSTNSVVYYNTLSAFDLDTYTFTEPANPNPPVALRDASAITAGQDTILFGGKAAHGWIGMNQLAMWEASSWSYKTVQNSALVDSRTDPVLCLNEAGTKVIVSGGSVDGRDADPRLLVLELSDSDDGWSWYMPKVNYYPQLQGATMLPGDIMLGITNDVEPKAVLLNTSSWTYLSSYTQSVLPAANGTSKSSPPSHSQLSSGSIAAISTSSAIASIVLLVTIFALVYKRRRQSRPLGPLTPHSDHGLFLTPSRYSEKLLNSDSASGVGSVNTWKERRRSWIKKYSDIFGPINNDDANSSVSADPAADSALQSAVSAPAGGLPFADDFDLDKNSESTLFGISRRSLRSLKSLRRSSKWTNQSTLTGDSRTAADRRSFGSQGFRRRSSGAHSRGHGPPSADAAESPAKTDLESDEDIYEYFKDREVQVLVSTTRRGQLRITNPDDDADERDTEDKRNEESDKSLSRLNSTSSKTRWLVGKEQNEEK